MSYEAKILADSVASNGIDMIRLTTLQITMPRFILAEFNTHRVFSRNSASSRAIPVDKRISMIMSDPFIPEAFCANKRGMVAGEKLDPIAQEHARDIWIQASRSACQFARELEKIKVHKQWANRLLEPFAWHTVVCTSTEWENFFNLRAHPEAQPEIQEVARLMREAMLASRPNLLGEGEWHMPFITDEDINDSRDNLTCTPDYNWLVKLATARCARVSYLTHDTGKRDPDKDLELHDRLLENGHMSPFEHCARVASFEVPGDLPEFIGNFRAPWEQYRKLIPNEAVFRGGK